MDVKKVHCAVHTSVVPALLLVTTSGTVTTKQAINLQFSKIGKWFEPRGISYWFVVIVRVFQKFGNGAQPKETRDLQHNTTVLTESLYYFM